MEILLGTVVIVSKRALEEKKGVEARGRGKGNTRVPRVPFCFLIDLGAVSWIGRKDGSNVFKPTVYIKQRRF